MQMNNKFLLLPIFLMSLMINTLTLKEKEHRMEMHLQALPILAANAIACHALLKSDLEITESEDELCRDAIYEHLKRLKEFRQLRETAPSDVLKN